MSKNWIVQNNVAFALVPRKGMTGLKETLFENGLVRYHDNDEIDHVDTRVLFLSKDKAQWEDQKAEVTLDGFYIPTQTHTLDQLEEVWGDYSDAQRPYIM